MLRTGHSEEFNGRQVPSRRGAELYIEESETERPNASGMLEEN